MPPEQPGDGEKSFQTLTAGEPTTQERQIAELQEQLTQERDGRREDRFVGLVCLVILLDIVFFSVMHTSGAPLALVVLELLILIPVARRMGMEEVAQILNGFVGRMAGKPRQDD
jgi:hypothetical protein